MLIQIQKFVYFTCVLLLVFLMQYYTVTVYVEIALRMKFKLEILPIT